MAAALVAAIVVHIALAVWLFLVRPWDASVGDVSPQTAANTSSEPDTSAEAAEKAALAERAQLRGRLDNTVNMFLNKDREELTEKAHGAAEWLETRSSDDAISDIGAAVQNACQVGPRAYAPVDPPPPGEFDHDTMLPYAVKKVVSEDGKTQVVYTWVDAQGRSLETEVLEEASDPALTTALQMAQRSPVMRQLFQTSVLPVLEAQLRQRR